MTDQELAAELRKPRLMADGGDIDPEARAADVAGDELVEARNKLTRPGSFGVDGAAVILNRAIRRLVEVSEVHEATDCGGFILTIEEEQ